MQILFTKLRLAIQIIGLVLLLVACGSSVEDASPIPPPAGDPENKWDQMKWDQGKWQ